MVCGSDGNTYTNLCQLMEVAYKNGTQDAPKVQMWGPCESGEQQPKDERAKLCKAQLISQTKLGIRNNSGPSKMRSIHKLRVFASNDFYTLHSNFYVAHDWYYIQIPQGHD